MSLPKRPFFLALLSHSFSSSPSSYSSSSSAAITARRRKPFVYVPSKYRAVAIVEAQRSVRDYLHQNRSLPFVFADQIARNSPFCLSNFLRNVQFSMFTFAYLFKKSFRYEPLNEFEFFFESIGIDYFDIPRFLPPQNFFFSQDSTVFDSARELFRFGFPWNKLGKLYMEDASIFRKSPEELEEKLSALKERIGSDNLSVVGLCLAFPCLLSNKAQFRSEDLDRISSILKRVFGELGVESGVEGNVDTWYEACCKVRIFYDSGVEMGKVEELMWEKKEIFVKCPLEVLVLKFVYFSKFGTGKLEVGMFLLRNPEILSLDLETRAISVLGILEHLGLDEEALRQVGRKRSYVMGRNSMAYLPNAMKALDLHEWCFDKIKSSNGKLLETYAISCPEDGLDKKFVEGWKRIESSRFIVHERKKLSFLKEIGFGENDATLRTLNNLQGQVVGLHEKFDFFLRSGVKHSDACYMVRRAPLFLSRTMEKIEKKTNYLLHGMGCSINFVVKFPGFYTLDLECRLKSRHMVYLWLQELGCRPKYTLSGMLQVPHKEFIRRLYKIHPAVPKHFLERF